MGLQENQGAGERAHVGGTASKAPSASPAEELPQRRGLGEREPLTLLGKSWVELGAQG